MKEGSIKKLNFKIVRYDSFGNITVSINGCQYTYVIGGHQIERVIYLARRTPGKALNYLKQIGGKVWKS